MSTLYRTRLYVRHSLPMYPFTPHAVEQAGEYREKPGPNGRLQQHVISPAGWPIEFEGGPRWSTSREDGIRAAIKEAEEAAAALAAVLDGLRQELLNDQRHAVAHERPHQLHPPVSTSSSESRAVESRGNLPT